MSTFFCWQWRCWNNMSRYTRPYRHHATSQPTLATNLNATKRVEGRGHYTPPNRYVVDFILYFVCTNAFDIVDFDATIRRRRGKTSLSSPCHFWARREGKPSATLHNLGIEYSYSILRVSTVYCPLPPRPPSKSSANARFQGWWTLPVSHPRRRAAKACFCAHHQSRQWKRRPLPNDRVRRGVMPSSSCRSFLFDRLSTRCAYLIVPSLCLSKRWGGTSLLIMPSLCFSTWHDRGGYSSSSRLRAIPFINNMQIICNV